MKENLNTILDEIKASLRDMQQNEALQELKVKYLGKKGEITQMMKQMGSLSPEERPVLGRRSTPCAKRRRRPLRKNAWRFPKGRKTPGWRQKRSMSPCPAGKTASAACIL